MSAFEWDEGKERRNRRKHGVSFEQARSVFGDPFALTLHDRVVDGEERWHVIGRSADGAVLIVAHCVQLQAGDETIRIISARHAMRHERERYETQAYQDR